jgi:hypothetical protein
MPPDSAYIYILFFPIAHKTPFVHLMVQVKVEFFTILLALLLPAMLHAIAVPLPRGCGTT